MPLVLADRVRDTTTTTGTGTVTLSGTAPTGYQSFAVIGNGNTTYYTINAGSQWEVGIGTYSSTGPTLARNTVLESSNSNALVDFAAGTKDVFVTYPADKSVNYDESNNVGIGTTTPSAKLEVTGSTNANFAASIFRNTNAGSSAATSVQLGNDVSAAASSIRINANANSSNPNALRISNNISGDSSNIILANNGDAERMRITSAGLVQINTTSGAGWLNVNSSSGAASILLTNSANSNPFIQFANGAFIQGIGSGGSEDLRFRAGGTTGVLVFDTNSTERMRINNDGNVAIGTSSFLGLLTVGSGSGASTAFQYLNAGSGGSALIGRISGNNTWFVGDTNAAFGSGTGLVNFAYGANPILFATNSTERMRIDSAGNVGIGTASPAGRMAVASATGNTGFNTGTSSSPERGNLWYDTDGTGWKFNIGKLQSGAFTAQMTFQDNGNVGIGTTSPGARLDVNGQARASTLFATSTTASSFTTRLANDPEFQLYASNGVTGGGSGSVKATIGLYFSDTLANLNGGIQFTRGGAGLDGWMNFLTSGTERMRIASDGNVGIGTTTPDIFGRFYTRTVGINSSGTTMLQINGTTYGGIDLGFNGARTANLLAETAGFYLQTVTASPMVFVTNSSERMRITSAGNVGIGTTSPARPLDVNGSIRVASTSNVEWGGDANYITGSTAGLLAFATAGSERMRIDSSGNVGVATTAPGTTFEVALSTTGLPGLRASRSGAQTQYIQMDIGQGASARLFATGGNKAMFITNNNTGAALGTATDSTFIQVPGPTANTPITAMYLESSTANVGIGTTTPAGRLHAVNSYTNSSDATIIAGGNIPGINLRASGGGRFSILANFGATNTTSLAAATGTSNPAEVMRIDHASGAFIIGTGAPNAAAQLQVDSVLRGFLPPRMTTVQRDAITTPPDGLMLYNTTTNKLQVRAAGAWVDLH